jgi:hypothetical protein
MFDIALGCAAINTLTKANQYQLSGLQALLFVFRSLVSEREKSVADRFVVYHRENSPGPCNR